MNIMLTSYNWQILPLINNNSRTIIILGDERWKRIKRWIQKILTVKQITAEIILAKIVKTVSQMKNLAKPLMMPELKIH